MHHLDPHAPPAAAARGSGSRNSARPHVSRSAGAACDDAPTSGTGWERQPGDLRALVLAIVLTALGVLAWWGIWMWLRGVVGDLLAML